MIRLGSPWWLLLLIVVIARAVMMLVDWRRGRAAFRFSSLALIRGGSSWRTATAWIAPLLELAGMVLITFALARPQLVTMHADERRGIDIVVALDASGSMAAEDFRPRNRFTVAKSVIGQFIDRRQNDRIGIVTFGGRAATRVPVTFDRQVARAVLERAEIGDHGDRTAIGLAMATSVNRLRGSKAASRVLILVTDGVNNAGSIDPRTAADVAKRAGIRIYTIGVGSRGPVPLPQRVQNRFTGEVETVYQLIRADLDEEMLTEVATLTGGSYFRATDADALDSVLRRIDELETTELAAPPTTVVEERFAPLLAAGLAFLALALLGGETIWMRLPA